MKYTVIIEEGASSYGAFAPDLPGCIAAGKTKEEVLELIKEAIEFHIEGLKEDGNAIPKPHCDFTQIEVNAA
jgi:predicted RNase H-like HicB family nuclease